MRAPRVRFTIRRWMLYIVCVAVILAVVIQVRDWWRRRSIFQARIAQLKQEIEINRIGQNEVKAMYRPGEGELERASNALRRDELILRQKLSRLRP
jgi:hypothetical protein